MPENYIVEVENIHAATVTLKVTIVNAQVPEIYDEKSFALMLLHDVFLSWYKPKPPLLESVSEDDMLNPKWIHAHCEEYIQEVKLSEWKNFPPPTNVSFRELAPDLLPSAKMQIWVTDAKWISHLSPGDKWESWAFNIASYL